MNHVGRFLAGKIMKQLKNKKGYHVLVLNKNGKSKTLSIHRLVALAFINNPNPEKFHAVDHINGIKNDNRVVNLRWLDNRENTVDGYRRKDTSSKYEGVCWSKNSSKWKSEIMFNNKKYHIGYFNNEVEAHKAYLIALEKGENILKTELIEKQKLKGVNKLNGKYYFHSTLNGKKFNSKTVKTQEEAIFIKQEVLKDFSNINKYREIPYNLKEEFSKLDIKALKKNKYYDSFKQILELQILTRIIKHKIKT